MTKQKSKRFLLALGLCLSTLLGSAQGPGDPGDPGIDPDPNRDSQIPLDGGISLVIAAGVAYAAKKGIDKRKRDKQVSAGE